MDQSKRTITRISESGEETEIDYDRVVTDGKNNKPQKKTKEQIGQFLDQIINEANTKRAIVNKEIRLKNSSLMVVIMVLSSAAFYFSQGLLAFPVIVCAYFILSGENPDLAIDEELVMKLYDANLHTSQNVLEKVILATDYAESRSYDYDHDLGKYLHRRVYQARQLLSFLDKKKRAHAIKDAPSLISQAGQWQILDHSKAFCSLADVKYFETYYPGLTIYNNLKNPSLIVATVNESSGKGKNLHGSPDNNFEKDLKHSLKSSFKLKEHWIVSYSDGGLYNIRPEKLVELLTSDEKINTGSNSAAFEFNRESANLEQRYLEAKRLLAIGISIDEIVHRTRLPKTEVRRLWVRQDRSAFIYRR